MWNGKTIFITIIRGSLVRNFFHTGIIQGLLNQGIRLVILTPNADSALFGGYTHPNLVFEPLIAKEKKYQKVFEEMYRGAVFGKTVHFMYRYRFAGDLVPSVKSLTLFYALRMLFMMPLRYIPGAKRLIRWADFKINPERQHDYLFLKYKPDLVFNTASRADYGILKSAKRYGVPTVEMPKSWDNLSKYLCNMKTDRMIVWSPFMKEQAVRLQGYKPHEVIMTGVPQFDFYARKDGLISREEFCRQFGFDPQKKIILFASSGGDLCDEGYYPELLKKFIDEGKLPPSSVLIRPHLGYKNDAERFANLRGVTGFSIDTRDTQESDKFKDNWDTSLGHVHRLVNSLYHADVMVNIASTMTLDAGACGTPVINIKFDVAPDVNRHFSTRRLYKTDYGNAVTSAGGTWLVESREAYLKALKDILEKGEKKEQERGAMIEHFIFKNDGKSAERLADILISLLEKPQRVSELNNPRRYSIKELRQACQGIPDVVVQTKAGEVSRIFSIYLTWLFLRLNATPNQLTFFGSALYIGGAMLFAFNNQALAFTAFAFMIFATLIDASDGEVARFWGRKGGYGGSYVEPLSHDIMYGFMFMPIAYGAFLKTGEPLMLIAGAAATIFKLLFRMTQARFFYGVQQLLQRKGHTDDTKKLVETRDGHRLYWFYRNLATSSGLHVFLLLAIITNRLDFFIVAYAFIFCALWVGLFVRQVFRFSKISQQTIKQSTLS